ncbi:hypothetical protein TBLA_0F03960 [Henningerozyma blattae CBS 6284]|uniref:Mitochondrial import inner membrane translocase subunit TIM23 n=1 Tax=Henningerozyma blattae (strain ATCC 34711 / CBS 6284 / DSM 70876 / NBRC 10599 / NRRL Y-10934 / UCD 77-7) TaxID=1071380 RepID=I2H6C8_HENB6|nr:hypothetical protein TBLA_0F03960 [Tetrapisispora blattae CBS 6284]CCH61930.1 hypothetical protein TBLA_0F03960 [Tetrapisispora blattae CBS 6284]
MSWLSNDDSTSKLKETLGFDPSSIQLPTSANSGISGLNISHPLYGLDKGIEYLDLDDEKLSTVQGSQGIIPSRGWSDDLCYGTGSVYLLGLGFGGAMGLIDGLSSINRNYSGKLKLNTILNSITKRGPHWGNNAGVLAMTYNLINSSLDSYRGKHDSMGSVVSGALTGAIFKSSKGVKPMVIASGLTAGAAGLWCGVKKQILE